MKFLFLNNLSNGDCNCQAKYLTFLFFLSVIDVLGRPYLVSSLMSSWPPENVCTTHKRAIVTWHCYKGRLYHFKCFTVLNSILDAKLQKNCDLTFHRTQTKCCSWLNYNMYYWYWKCYQRVERNYKKKVMTSSIDKRQYAQLKSSC